MNLNEKFQKIKLKSLEAILITSVSIALVSTFVAGTYGLSKLHQYQRIGQKSIDYGCYKGHAPLKIWYQAISRSEEKNHCQILNGEYCGENK